MSGNGNSSGFSKRAVLDGKIRFLSVSQLQKFDPNVDGGCNARWAFQYMLGKKEEQTDAQRKGEEYAKQLENYLKTGQDALVPELRAGKHLLPRPGADLDVEQSFTLLNTTGNKDEDFKIIVSLRDQVLRGAAGALDELRERAGLLACDIPFIGAPDVRHRRGEYIDPAGVLRREEHGDRVVENIDHKTTSRINDHAKRSGEIDKGWAKSVEQIEGDHQLNGYGKVALKKHPGAEYVRNSLNYYQTKHGYAADKRTILIPAERIHRHWSECVEPIVRTMASVAAAKIEDIERNPRSCNAFRRRCTHYDYCKPDLSVFELFDTKRNGEEKMPSLFDTVNDTSANGVSAAPPPIPPRLSDAEYERQKEEAKARLAAEGASYGNCGCGAALSAANASRLPSGVVKHIGCPAAVNPPDQPKPDFASSANPLPREEIEKIENPELRARAEAHAAAVEAAKPPELPTAPGQKKSGKCEGSGKSVTLSPKEIAAKKKACPECGKEVKITVGDDFTILMPGHFPPKGEAASQSQAAQEPPPPLPSAAKPDQQTAGYAAVIQSQAAAALPEIPAIPSVAEAPPPLPKSSPPTIATAQGIVLYVDIFFEKGEAPASLDDWYLDCIRTLEKRYEVSDIRMAPNNSDIGYGRWKGALAAVCKSNLPPPGEYQIRGMATSEFVPVIVEALTPHCSKVRRAIR